MRRVSGILLPILILGGCAESAPEPELLRPVRSEIVAYGGATRIRGFSGTARAGQETNLSFRVPGRIVKVAVEVGDVVEPGQLIAQLEQRDFEISVRQVEARLAQSRARSRNADANLDRIRRLYENDTASKNDLDSALAAQQAAAAAVVADNQELESARRRLGYTSLRAPVSGAIASVPVEPNENVVQGQLVARMTSGARPEVEVAIPELLISQIHRGDPVTVEFDALADVVLDAVVTEVGVAATGTATTFPVTVRLAGSAPRRAIGHGRDGRVPLRDRAGRAALPARARGRRGPGGQVRLRRRAGGGAGRGRGAALARRGR